MAITSREEMADLIASIEAERQAAARESGNASACIAALRTLQELQKREKEALMTSGPSDIHSANLAALGAEIAKVQRLAGSERTASQWSHSRPGTSARHTAPPAAAKNSGRKKAKRSGSR